MKESEDTAPVPLGFWDQLKVLKGCGGAYWVVNLVNFTDGIAYFGILNLLILYLTRDLHVLDARAGWFVSIFTGLVALFMVPGGRISDRLGTRNAISLSLLTGVLGRGGLWLAGSLPGSVAPAVALISLIVMAAATGILQPALYAGVKETTTTRVATMGFSLLYAIMNLGIMAESLVSPFIRTDSGLNWGIRGVLGCMAAITLLQLIVHLLLFPRSKRAVNAAAEDAIEPEESLPAGSTRGLWDPRFLYFIFILLPVRTLFAHQWLTVPDYIFRCFDKGVADRYEWFSALNPAVVTVGVPLFCFLTGKVPVLRMMIIGTAVSAAATFLLSLPPDPSRLITYIMVFSLGEALWASRFLEYVADLAPPGKVGAYMGVANLPWFLAKFTTGLYSGAMIANYLPKTGLQHPETLWTIYGCIACITPVGLLLAANWLQKSPREKVSEP